MLRKKKMKIMEKFQEFNSLKDEIIEELERKSREIAQKKVEINENEMFSQYNQEHINNFFTKPYTIIPRKEEEWYLAIPKFFDVNVGYLFKSDDSYNVFIVNKYADYLGNVPKEFKDVFKFKPKMPLKVFDGVVLTGEKYQDQTWERYRKFLTAREGKDKIRIKRGKAFNFTAQLISDGILPFIPKPVEENHTITGIWKKHIPEIEKRRHMNFFKDAVNKFMQTGAIGVYWAMGVGKTIIGLELLSRINVDNKPNLVISGASATLREQWKENLKLIKSASRTEVETYQSFHKVVNKDWGLIVLDECHHLPANTYSRMSRLSAEYRLGLSATPFREDKRTDLIFALTGYPIGLEWKALVDLGLIKAPDITLYLCRDYNAKKKKLKELLQDITKTLVYCFSVGIGKKLSKECDIPFVYGATPHKERKEIIENSIATIVSSVGKEGLSLQDIKRTITYNFLFGSRQEETQFFGRLLHGKNKGEHIIMMTDEEYEKYGKRIYGIQEKGFKIRLARV